ncbi:MAG: hypothetical protein NT133_26085 [Alphaproteobacteria bacterium]|nr:hypothetical protein [Alphaproteobacteria bacterium]
MKFIVAATAVAITFAQALVGTAAADAGIRQEKVQFAKGASSAVIKGQIKGSTTVDYVVRAAAGQTLPVKLQKTNVQNYFNVLPPGSMGNAMFVGDSGENYTGVLPADGDYIVRVYLMRPAARRGETSNYTLTIGVTGKPLAPIAASKDAVIPGTSYHASARIKCVPWFEAAPRECDAFVIRRSFDGTATIDIPGGAEKRSILFVKGKPVASNALAMDVLTVERKGDVTIVMLGTSERYEIPDVLLTGG